MGERTIWRLDPCVPADWILLAQTLERLARFAQQDGHGIVHTMSEAMRQWTAPQRGERPGAAAWVAVVDGTVVGHVVAEVARESDTWFVNVAQYVADRGHAWTRAERERVLGDIRAWGASLGIEQVRCTTRSPALARAFALLGFIDTGRRVLVLQRGAHG